MSLGKDVKGANPKALHTLSNSVGIGVGRPILGVSPSILRKGGDDATVAYVSSRVFSVID